MQYQLEDSRPQIAIRPMKGSTVAKEPQVLARCVELWKQLDGETIQKDMGKFGLKMKTLTDSELTELFKMKLAGSESVTILIVNSQIIGMARVSTDMEYQNCFYISTICIDRPFRRQGYGKVLLKYLMDRRPGRVPMLSVSMANPEAVSFYNSLGFKPISQTMALIK